MTRFDRVSSRGLAGDRDVDSGPETAQSRGMPVTQLRALRNVMRSGTSLPGGAQVTNTQGNPDEVLGALDQLSKSLLAGNFGSPPRWEETNAGARINSLLSRSNFSDDLIQINHAETRGINMNWTGSVTLRIVNPMLVSEGTGEFTASGGGGSTNSSGTSTTNTDSAEISGHAGGDKGGGAATAGTSTGTTTSRGNAEASGSATGAKTNGRVRDTGAIAGTRRLPVQLGSSR